MAVCWDLPLRDSFGNTLHLRAVVRVDPHGNADVIETSDRRLDRDERRHLEREFWNNGVAYAVTKDRIPSTLIYYKEDGTPWLNHHGVISNTSGNPDPIDDRIKRVRLKRKAEERQRAERRRQYEEERRVVGALKGETVLREATREQDELESNPLWGLF